MPDASLQIDRTAHPIEGGFEYPFEQALRRSFDPKPAMAPKFSIRIGTDIIFQRLLEKRLEPILKRFRILQDQRGRPDALHVKLLLPALEGESNVPGSQKLLLESKILRNSTDQSIDRPDPLSLLRVIAKRTHQPPRGLRNILVQFGKHPDQSDPITCLTAPRQIDRPVIRIPCKRLDVLIRQRTVFEEMHIPIHVQRMLRLLRLRSETIHILVNNVRNPRSSRWKPPLQRPPLHLHAHDLQIVQPKIPRTGIPRHLP